MSDEVKVEEEPNKPNLRSTNAETWNYQTTSFSNIKKKVKNAIKERVPNHADFNDVLVISSSKVKSKLLNKGLYDDEGLAYNATYDGKLFVNFLVLLIDNYYHFNLESCDNLKNWMRIQISQQYGNIQFKFVELFEKYDELEKIESSLESESETEFQTDLSAKNLEQLAAALQNLQFGQPNQVSRVVPPAPPTATVNTVTTSISDKLSAPVFKVDYDDAYETMNTMEKLIGILGTDSVGTLILKFCNQNNLHHLIQNLSQASLKDFSKFKAEFLKRYSYTDCSQSFLTIEQNPGEDEFDLLERCKRRILIMRDESERQNDLTKSETHLIRERFLSSLSDPAIRTKTVLE